jgi:hypothetical protein
MKKIVLIFLSLTLYAVISHNYVTAFYVPGVAPQDFSKRDPVEVKVNQY